jgi:Terminase RNaseH-like domain
LGHPGRLGLTAMSIFGYRPSPEPDRVPQDPGAAGKFEARQLAGLLQGYQVASEREKGNKENRADPFASQCEQGYVKLVEGAWNHAFVEELCAFPNGAHDDQVDAASAAFRALLRRRPMILHEPRAPLARPWQAAEGARAVGSSLDTRDLKDESVARRPPVMSAWLVTSESGTKGIGKDAARFPLSGVKGK